MARGRRVLVGMLLWTVVAGLAPRTAAGTVLTFVPAADATIKAKSPTQKFGSSIRLEADGSPVVQFLLKFLVTGVGGQTVTSAKLRLYNVNGSDRGGDIRRVGDSTWSEATVTWNTAPAVGPTILASLGAVTSGRWYEVDLTGHVTGDGYWSFHVSSTSIDAAEYRSKEAGLSFAPTLVLTVSGGPLTATASAGTGPGNEGAPVLLTGSASGGTGPYTFGWTFGDGASGAGSPVTHAYGDNGTYVATLTVTDAAGGTATAGVSVTVLNVAPTASAGGPYAGTVGSPMAFSGTATDPGTADTAAGLQFLWEFGDGTTGAGSAASHAYAAAGTYTVRLTVTDKDGGSGSATTTATVGAPLTVDAGPDHLGSEGDTLGFTGSATGGISPLTYAWEFGDGTTASGSSVTHVYRDNGTFAVTLTVTDAAALTARDTALVTLANVAPTGNAGGPYAGTVGSPMAFSGTATDPGTADTAAGFQFLWEFGDGTTGTGSASSHAYAAAGTYTVRVTVTDKDGGSGSATTTATASSTSSTTLPPGVYGKVGPRTAIPAGMKANLGIVGFEVDPHWDEFETQDNAFDWVYLDSVIADAQASGLKVVISVQMSLVFAPSWIKNDPRVQTVTVQGQTVPVYWDPIYQAQKAELIQELGRHVAAHPEWADTVVGIKVGVANFQWNELNVPHDSPSTNKWLNAGYSTTRMLTETVMFDGAAAAFPAGAVRFAYHVTSAALDGTQTNLSEQLLAHGHGDPGYHQRFYSQVDFLSTEKPYAFDARVTGAQPGQFDYLYKLLTLHQPNIGLEMVDSAALGPTTGCRLNNSVSPCDPIPVLQKAFDIGLTYRPRYVTVWQDDGKDSGFAAIFEDITCRLGGTLRGGKPCPLTANVGPAPTGAEGAALTFSGSGSGMPPLTYTWTFGDGASATGATASHAYGDNGTFLATLTVTDAAGGTATDVVNVTVLNVAPTANAGGPYAGATGSPIAFSGSATDPGTADTAAGFGFLWAFGDGTTGGGASSGHAYAAAGTYTVGLTVTDKDGGSGTATTVVTVSDPAPPAGQTLTFSPVADATIKQGSPTSNYGGATILEADGSPVEQFLLTFLVSGVGGRTVTSVKLRLYNVNSSNAGGDIRRADPNWSEATVTWTTAPAVDPPILASLGAVTSGQWYAVDLTGHVTGDGLWGFHVSSQSSDGADYRSKEGGAATSPQLIVVTNPGGGTPGPLTASAGPDQVGSEGAGFWFSGSATGGTSPYAFAWTFGDGTSGSGPSVRHAYGDNGTFAVTLTVTDAAAPPASATAAVSVVVVNVAPTASAGGPYAGATGSPIVFSGSATDPGTADTAAGFQMLWDFGDGTTGSGRSPSHAYSAAGTYTVGLTVTDKDGASGTATTTVTVSNPAPAGTPFVFTAAGDYGGSSQTTAVLQSIVPAGSGLHIALGDLSYGALMPESAWCDYVKSHVGAIFPFELISGNHEADLEGSPGNHIDGFIQCLPHQALASVVGDYGKQYYFDYNGLARFILISPNHTIDGTLYSYGAGSTRYNWVASAIDGARAAGIPWVVVGMHQNCITMGVKSCSIGADLFNLLLAKRVDLVLQAHDHGYQRSKQLVPGPSCASVVAGTYNPGCVADDGADGQYTKGAGTVLSIVGTGGQGLYDVSTADSEAGYFASWMGGNSSNPSWGLLKVTVTGTALSAEFGPALGTFTDRFTIAAP